MNFQAIEADSITLRFGWQQYLRGFYDAETQPGSFVQSETQLTFALFDMTASSYLMYYVLPALNYTVRLDGTGPLEIENDSGLEFFTVAGAPLQAGHDYSLAFSHLTYSRGMIAAPVPEPSTILMYLGGLGCLLALIARRQVPWARRALAALVLAMPGAVWAAEGSSALAGFDLYGPRLMHSDGTRYTWDDLAARAPISPYGTAWTAADRHEETSGIISFSNGARQSLHACTGTDCPASAFPAALSGDTADASHQAWQMPDFVGADAYQHTQVNASALSHSSRAEIRTHTEMWNFSVTSPDSMTIEFDARAFGLVDGDASATLSFHAWVKENWTGSVFNLLPNALNMQLHRGDAAYDSGLQTFTLHIPAAIPGPGYFLVLEQTLIASAIPEPAPAALYSFGLVGMLAWAAKRGGIDVQQIGRRL